jgi:hypothetical protein
MYKLPTINNKIHVFPVCCVDQIKYPDIITTVLHIQLTSYSSFRGYEKDIMMLSKRKEHLCTLLKTTR